MSELLRYNRIYRIYSKYWDILAPFHNCLFVYLLMCFKTARGVANSVDTDQRLRSAASDQCLHFATPLAVLKHNVWPTT